MSNKTIAENIDIEELQEERFELDELVKDIKEDLKESNLLLSSKYVKSKFAIKQEFSGIFEDDLWVMMHSLNQTNTYFDFSEFERLKFKGVTNDDITLIKCWIAEYIIDLKIEYEDDVEFRSIESARKGMRIIFDFIQESSNFNADYLDQTKGSKLNYYFDKKKNDGTRAYEISKILNYIDYIIDKVSSKRASTLVEYTIKLNRKLGELNVKSQARQLPTSKDILLFANYLHVFFSDKDINKEIKLYYMPILIWWKITSVIPMRPSEFARKLKRDSLIKEGENYYLRIDRIKKKASPKLKLLPVLNRVKITKEIYDLISDYITKTDKYGDSETLVSYEAIVELRYKILTLYPEMEISWNAFNEMKKINRAIFTNKIFYDMLVDFYNSVIVSIYKDTYIKERLKPGDTRHIAFTSLMLQGYSPVEIAIIGGHRTLQALDNYTCSVNSYIDTEVVSIIKKNINISTNNNSELIDIVFKMPTECPVPLEKCFEAEIDGENLGCCTADYKINPNPCESDDCDKCSKWWCKPNEYNFLKLERIVKNRLKNKDNKLKRDMDFLMSIMKKVGLEVINGKLVMDSKVAQGLRRISMELASNTKDIIHLKYQLINPSEDKFRLISDIEDLLPTKEVNEIIQEKAIEIQKGWEDKVIWQDLEQK